MLLRFIFLLMLCAAGSAAAAAEPKQEAIDSLLKSFEVKDNPIDGLLTLRYAINDVILQAAIDGLDADALPAIGGGGGGPVIYEFSDYQCGYCRRMHPVLTAAADTHGVKIALIELPILGALSEKAARLALAAREQGRFADFHNALMQRSGRLSEATINRVVKRLKLDRARLEADSESERVSRQLESNYKLAALLGVNGTPAFIIHGQLYPGALQEEDFLKLIEEQ